MSPPHHLTTSLSPCFFFFIYSVLSITPLLHHSSAPFLLSSISHIPAVGNKLYSSTLTSPPMFYFTASHHHFTALWRDKAANGVCLFTHPRRYWHYCLEFQLPFTSLLFFYLVTSSLHCFTTRHDSSWCFYFFTRSHYHFNPASHYTTAAGVSLSIHLVTSGTVSCTPTSALPRFFSFTWSHHHFFTLSLSL